MVGLHPMASVETRAPSRSRRSTRAGTAVISFDFSSTASWPSTSRLLVAKADTRCSALWPVLRFVATARGLAVDRHEVELVRPAFRDPCRKAGLEQARVDAVYHAAQPIGAGNAVVEFGAAA